jgi:hypothetical protein
MPNGRKLYELHLGLGGAWVRRFENEAQLVSALGLAYSTPLARRSPFAFMVDVEGLWVLPESELAATAFFGVTFTP